LKDLMPKGDPTPPPGVKPENFKVLTLDIVQIRALIGRGGETVQAIRAKTGAEIKIDCLQNETVGRAALVGDIPPTEALIKEALASKGCGLGVPAPPGGRPLIPGSPGAPGLPPPPLALPPPPGAPPPAPPPPGGAALAPAATAAPTGPVEHREVPIPADLVGGMIGPGGSTINDLRKMSGPGVQIAILPASVPGGQQHARISGAPPAIDNAEKLVRQKIEELMVRKPMAPPGGPGGPMRPPLAPPPGLPPGASPPGMAGGPVESREIGIPADLIGFLIGPGGSTINDLRKQAGPQVLIAIVPGSIPAAQGGQQLARISGTPAAVNTAEQLVRSKLQELQEVKNKANAGGPPGGMPGGPSSPDGPQSSDQSAPALMDGPANPPLLPAGAKTPGPLGGPMMMGGPPPGMAKAMPPGPGQVAMEARMTERQQRFQQMRQAPQNFRPPQPQGPRLGDVLQQGGASDLPPSSKFPPIAGMDNSQGGPPTGLSKFPPPGPHSPRGPPDSFPGPGGPPGLSGPPSGPPESPQQGDAAHQMMATGVMTSKSKGMGPPPAGLIVPPRPKFGAPGSDGPGAFGNGGPMDGPPPPPPGGGGSSDGFPPPPDGPPSTEGDFLSGFGGGGPLETGGFGSSSGGPGNNWGGPMGGPMDGPGAPMGGPPMGGPPMGGPPMGGPPPMAGTPVGGSLMAPLMDGPGGGPPGLAGPGPFSGPAPMDGGNSWDGGAPWNSSSTPSWNSGTAPAWDGGPAQSWDSSGAGASSSGPWEAWTPQSGPAPAPALAPTGAPPPAADGDSGWGSWGNWDAPQQGQQWQGQPSPGPWQDAP